MKSDYSTKAAESSRPYSRVVLDQGTPQWLAWRHNGIGASDAPVILGESPYKTADQLFDEKVGVVRDGGQNAAMARGTYLEPAARTAYCSALSRKVASACLQSTNHDWLRASVDGISDCGAFLVEIKCGLSAYRKTAQTRRPPDYYHGQLQHALAVTGLDEIDFWCYWPGCNSVHVTVKRDEPYIKKLLAAEEEFWRRVQGTRGATS